jgi:hypothetical protein
MAAPTLDATATGTATSATTVAATLTTSNTNDIICALITVQNAHTLLQVTGVSGGGLTWKRRSGLDVGQRLSSSFPSVSHELWWAVSSGTLTSQTITATFNATCDDASIIVMGVTGCNTTQPWDNNISLPAVQLSNAGTPSFTVSTTTNDCFLIFTNGSNFSGSLTLPTGFTSIGFVSAASGSLWATTAAGYKGVTSAQTNQTFTWGGSISETAASLFDALTADTCVLGTALPGLEVLATTDGQGASPSVQIAAASANDVIVVASYNEQSGGGPVITGISGGSLTWTKRTRSHSSSRGSLELWYAIASSAVSPTTAAITYTAGSDDYCVIAFTLANCAAAVFDSNGTVPADLSNTAGGTWTPSVTGISTSQSANVMLAMTGTSANATAVNTPPSGYVLLDVVNNAGGGLFADFGLGLKTVTAPQSSTTVTWGAAIADPSGANAGGEYVVDSFTGRVASSGGVFMGSVVS